MEAAPYKMPGLTGGGVMVAGEADSRKDSRAGLPGAHGGRTYGGWRTSMFRSNGADGDPNGGVANVASRGAPSQDSSRCDQAWHAASAGG